MTFKRCLCLNDFGLCVSWSGIELGPCVVFAFQNRSKGSEHTISGPECVMLRGFSYIFKFFKQINNGSRIFGSLIRNPASLYPNTRMRQSKKLPMLKSQKDPALALIKRCETTTML